MHAAQRAAGIPARAGTPGYRPGRGGLSSSPLAGEGRVGAKAVRPPPPRPAGGPPPAGRSASHHVGSWLVTHGSPPNSPRPRPSRSRASLSRAPAPRNAPPSRARAARPPGPGSAHPAAAAPAPRTPRPPPAAPSGTHPPASATHPGAGGPAPPSAHPRAKAPLPTRPPPTPPPRPSTATPSRPSPTPSRPNQRPRRSSPIRAGQGRAPPDSPSPINNPHRNNRPARHSPKIVFLRNGCSTRIKSRNPHPTPGFRPEPLHQISPFARPDHLGRAAPRRRRPFCHPLDTRTHESYLARLGGYM